MKRKKQRFLAVLLTIIMCLSLVGCTDEEFDYTEEDSQDGDSARQYDRQAEDGSWAIYWYLCGSDLETDGGFATTDLEEMLEVQLPENVNVVSRRVVLWNGRTKLWIRQ